MKNQQLFELFNALNTVTGLSGVRFNYAIAKNIATLKPEILSLQEALKASEEFNKYDTERIEIAKKHAKKDENGEPIKQNVGTQEQFIIEDKELFDKEFEALKEAHKEVYEARLKQLKDFEDLLEVENPVVLHKIKLSDIPEDIKTEQLAGIYPLIEE